VIEHGLRADLYHARPELGSTALREILRSPLHYYVAYEAPEGERVVRTETTALRVGTLVHAAALEPERWASDFVCAPDVNRSTKAGKEAWAEFCLGLGERVAVDPDEHDPGTGKSESATKNWAARKRGGR
jgi:hypothetical protein